MNISPRSILYMFCLFAFFSSESFGQSKFEFGVGLGINHSKIEEDIRTQSGPAETQYIGHRLLAVMTRVGYKINNRFHLNSGPGFSWLGRLKKDRSARVVATTFDLPLQLEYNIRHNIHLSSGPVYNYIVGMKNETNQLNSDILPRVDSRHQVGFRHGISFSNKLLELSVSYSHYLTNVFNFALTDANGNDVGTAVSKFSNIQIGIIFRK